MKNLVMVIIVILLGLSFCLGRISKGCHQKVEDFRLGNVLLGQKPISDGDATSLDRYVDDNMIPTKQVFYKDQYYNNKTEFEAYRIRR